MNVSPAGGGTVTNAVVRASVGRAPANDQPVTAAMARSARLAVRILGDGRWRTRTPELAVVSGMIGTKDARPPGKVAFGCGVFERTPHGRRVSPTETRVYDARVPSPTACVPPP